MTFQKNHGDRVQSVEQVPGAHRHLLVDGDNMMIIEWRMDAGVVVPIHNHPHEQSGYVVSGVMLFTADGAEHVLAPGMGYLVQGHVPHGARFPEPAVIVDIFSPPREDYRGDKPSTYTLKAATKKKTPALRKKVVKKKSKK